MNYSKAMDFVVSRFLLDHEIMYGGPPRKDMTMCDAEVNCEINDFENVLWFEAIGWPCEVIVRDYLEEGFHVT